MNPLVALLLSACLSSDILDRDGDGHLPADLDGGDDCDDTRPDVFPGAEEVCDTVDNDCDGLIDEEVTETFFTDSDGDGYGSSTEPVEACSQDVGLAIVSGDCDDADASRHPDASETPYDDVDDDCDGEDLSDVDGDGFEGAPAGGNDCDDADPAVNPGATESWFDHDVDNDCDGDAFPGVTLQAADIPTRIDGVVAGAELGRRLTWVTDEACLLASATDTVHAILPASGIQSVATEGAAVLDSSTGSHLHPGAAAEGQAALLAATAHSGSGAAYLVSTDTLCGGATLTIPDDAAHVVKGTPTEAYFGTSSRWLDDIDGDGLPDLAVSAVLDPAGGSMRGAVYIWSGAPPEGVSFDVDADWVLQGDADGSRLQQVETAHDADGPGLPYLIVAERVTTGGEIGVHRVSATALTSAPVSDISDGGIASWATHTDMSLAVIGDMDNDGSDDIFAGAWTIGFWEVRDMDGSHLDTETELGLAWDSEGDWLTGVTPVGDLDGDGRADLLVQAEDWPNYTERGMVGFLMATDLIPSGTLDFGALKMYATGASESDHFGYRATPAGDFDTDGHTDIAVSAYGTGHGGTSAGSVYLLPSPF